jgi:putative CocE/NonD family hydrolase
LFLIEKSTTFRYDPADPTPSIGGPLQSRTQGQHDNVRLEKRADVLTFTGEPLEEAVEVMGAVRAEFDADTTAASADLFARLCDVDPAGRSINVCDGLTRFTISGRVVVEMGPTAHRFRPGHRIRLLVAGGAHPRFLRNYGTGEPPGPATRMVATTTTVGPTSSLVLPVV